MATEEKNYLYRMKQKMTEKTNGTNGARGISTIEIPATFPKNLTDDRNINVGRKTITRVSNVCNLTCLLKLPLTGNYSF